MVGGWLLVNVAYSLHPCSYFWSVEKAASIRDRIYQTGSCKLFQKVKAVSFVCPSSVSPTLHSTVKARCQVLSGVGQRQAAVSHWVPYDCQGKLSEIGVSLLFTTEQITYQITCCHFRRWGHLMNYLSSMCSKMHFCAAGLFHQYFHYPRCHQLTNLQN